LFRDFQPSGQARALALKPPKSTQHVALMRHFRQCIAGQTRPEVGPDHGLALMRMVEAIYASIAKQKIVRASPPAQQADAPRPADQPSPPPSSRV